MAKRSAFAAEPITKPEHRAARLVATSDVAPRRPRRYPHDAPTMPPPANATEHTESEPKTRASAIRTKVRTTSAATVDTVTANLKRDPRCDDDDEEDTVNGPAPTPRHARHPR